MIDDAEQVERTMLMHHLEHMNEEWSLLTRAEKAQYRADQKRFLYLCEKSHRIAPIPKVDSAHDKPTA